MADTLVSVVEMQREFVQSCRNQLVSNGRTCSNSKSFIRLLTLRVVDAPLDLYASIPSIVSSKAFVAYSRIVPEAKRGWGRSYLWHQRNSCPRPV